tara:strand:- start:1127 stop:1765 length:639 start_codon:yes stop_codon:yes gene_type:complete
MWHSLNENGEIEIYDVQWPDGTVETNIPVRLLESVHEGTHNEGEKHGVQEKDTPISERKYKRKTMKITKRQLKRIIKEAMSSETSYPAIEKFDRLRREGDLALKSWLGFMSRQPIGDLGDLAKLWSGMVAAPGDIQAARELASALGVATGSATFHARKMSPGKDYPSGAELEELVISYRDEIKKKRAANPPPPRPTKPYGGGTRNRPWDRST